MEPETPHTTTAAANIARFRLTIFITISLFTLLSAFAA
jgi:hypothetical protein